MSLVENTWMINIGQRIISEDQMNPKMVKGCDKIAINTNPCECNVKNHVRSDRVSSNDDNDCSKSDGSDALLDSVVRSKNETSRGVIDLEDGAWISKLCDIPEFIIDMYKAQMYSCNRTPGSFARFLKMVIEDDDTLKVTATGQRHDSDTIWLTHFTVTDEFGQVIIFENEKCSEETGMRCVLYTQQLENSEDFILTGKRIDAIPEMLSGLDPHIGFIRRQKEIGSELLMFESKLTAPERRLLIGFDGDGQPIPLNTVRQSSPDFHAFFKILDVA